MQKCNWPLEVQAGVALTLPFCSSEWLLVESGPGLDKNNLSILQFFDGSAVAPVKEIYLTASRHGLIEQVIQLPRDSTSLIWQLGKVSQGGHPVLRLRKIGRIEGLARMLYRAVTTWQFIPERQRAISGLELGKIFLNLPEAYQLSNRFRWKPKYEDWSARVEALKPPERSSIVEHIARFFRSPFFRVWVIADESDSLPIEKTVRSLRSQLYPHLEYVVMADKTEVLENLDEARFIVTGERAVWLSRFNTSLCGMNADDWIVLLRTGDVLPEHALYWFACEVNANPQAELIYADDDALDSRGNRMQPRFKPDWSPEHLRSSNYIGRAVAIRGRALAEAGGLAGNDFASDVYDLLLRIAEKCGPDVAKVRHIPAVLLHRDDVSVDTDVQLAALNAHLARQQIGAEASETLPGCYRVRYALPARPPRVSIVVPTRNAVELLRQCVESVLEKSTYLDYELLVVDNGSDDSEALSYLERLAERDKVRVLRYDHAFNFSAINNFAVQQATGEVVCLLNNDTEIISPDWLEEMVSRLWQPGIGIVGAKLYFPDGTVQHAGDAVGPSGCADHLHPKLARDEPGYCNRAMLAQELSAVTAACLVTRRELYLQLGGLDEKNFRVAFNDVDYCLRVQAAGYRVIFTPYAELYHHESASRGKENTWRRAWRGKREADRMRKRWRERMWHDPYYNPNLSYFRPDFSLSEFPRVSKPWQAD